MTKTIRRSRKARAAPVLLLRPRILLLDAQPPVWRQVLVPQMIPLDKLHDVIQAAMGWTDSHLHEFVISGVRYSPREHQDFEADVVAEERGVPLQVALRGTARTFEYVYDFGDDWHHAVIVESVEALAPGAPRGAQLECLGGENACPPEDVGGAWGYEEFLQAIADPAHPEHESTREWVARDFDPNHFDLSLANARVKSIKL
jgi:hypothetical protein